MSHQSAPRLIVSKHNLTGRDVWLDVWRGMAVLLMLETHCVNLFCREMDEQVAWMGWLNFINGLAAPSFLWIAGYLQGKSICKAISTGRSIASRSRLQRLGTVLLLGMLMQMPWSAFLQQQWTMEAWTPLFQYNILPCMAVSLGLLLWIGKVGRHSFHGLALLSALMVVLLSPAARHWQTGFMPLDQWLNRENGSLFPLFPWFGFGAVGLVMSRWTFSFRWWLLLGAVLTWGGHLTQSGPFYSEHPGFFAERLGWVLWLGCLAKGLAGFGQHWKLAGEVVQLAGRQSLFVYVFHLILLFALPLAGGRTLQQVYEQRLNWSQSMVALAIVTWSCLLSAWGYEWLKLRVRTLRGMTPAMTVGKTE